METELVNPNPWMMLPFGLLLALIALAPLLFSSWWNKHYPKVALALGAIVLAYYWLGLQAPARIWHTAHEYLSFIALIGSLFVVAGGIHIHVKGGATPLMNVLFLLVGALLANLLGTTGASMLLIRPWLRMNQYRVTSFHIIFFIFIVANVGGCLTPIGDPPLFLGYLTGIPFWWVARHCLPMWAVAMGLLLLIFLALDYRNYLRAPRHIRAEETGGAKKWGVEGLPNIFFLGIIIMAVFINDPPFLREGLMLAAALGSWFMTRKAIHAANHFNFHPIQEVAILFIGIFATMMPALDWLQGNAARLTHLTPGVMYWSAGSLSSFLDNAPTYLCFLKTIFGRFVDPDMVTQVQHLVQTHGADLAQATGAPAEQIRQTFAVLQKYHPAELATGRITTDEIEVAVLLGNPAYQALLVAISVSAVFFGANTYIGNGPNFMVKSIADQQKIRVPHFLEYIWKYTLPYLLPVLVVVWFLFFRH